MKWIVLGVATALMPAVTLAQAPPAVAGPKLDKPIDLTLPSPPDDAVLAGNGRYIAFTCPASQQFAIVDVTEAKIAKTLPMANNEDRIVGTLSRLYVFTPRFRTFQSYKLDAFEPDGKSRAFPKGMPNGPIGTMIAAPGANSLVFLYFPQSKLTGGLLPSASPVFGALGWKHFGPNNAWGPAELRVSHAGTLLIGYGGGYAGMEAAIIRNNRAEIWDEKYAGYIEWAMPSADGQYVYTANGHLGRNMAYAGGEKTGGPYQFPSVDPGFYFAAPKGMVLTENRKDDDGILRNARGSGRLSELTLYSSDNKKLVTVPTPNLDHPSNLPPDKRAFFLHSANVLVTVGGADKKTVRLQSLNVKEELDKAGGDYLLVVSAPTSAKRNNKYTYPVMVLSKKGGVTIAIDKGEPGMKMNGTTLVWDVPGPIRDREVSFRLSVTDASGKSILHTGRIAIFNP